MCEFAEQFAEHQTHNPSIYKEATNLCQSNWNMHPQIDPPQTLENSGFAEMANPHFFY